MIWLVDPFAGYPLVADEARKALIRTAYADLRRGTPPEQIESRAQAVLGEDEGYHPAVVLLAQAWYLQGRYREAAERLAPVVDSLRHYVAAALLHARALEETGDVAAAYRAYLGIAEIQPAAAARAIHLADAALDVMHARFDAAMARGRIDEAEEHLAVLDSWAPEAARTLESVRRLQVATSDAVGELTTLRRLVDVEPTPERRLRTAILEVEVGSLRAGLDALERFDPGVLVEPADRERLARAVERGRFLRRLDLLPAKVREITEQSQLTRGDLASLIYWLFPGVRFAPLDDPPIAGDILDHPFRSEILKVAGREVMEVDQTVHRFYPQRPVTRNEALASLLVLLSEGDPQPACLADSTEVRRGSHWVCDRATRCLLIDEVADCLPSAPLSGQEALNLVQRGLAQLGGGSGAAEPEPDS